ncbi:MAG: hypothetical protein LCI02_22645 [Proteobacteria bacterium]|nr:hypothetical protein [Pseudomonadota bacterium]
MGSTAGLLMLSAAAVAALGGVGVWAALRRPTRLRQRRQRDEALAAAALYTPATRVPPYGDPAPDPCAPGLSDHQRVDAMRALLLRGDHAAAAEAATATEPARLRDETMSTAPMAWKPTLPPDEADLIEARRGLKLRVRLGDHEHITV